MDIAILVTGLASAAFLATHLGLSSQSLRNGLVERFGEKGFQGFYALVALLSLSAMIACYVRASHHFYLWPPGPGVRHLPLLFMPFALIFIIGGVIIPNPSAVGMDTSLDRPNPVRGVLRITRHPVMWGIMIWAAVHILANGDLASLLFFSGFLLTALLGSIHLDRRMALSQGERWQRFSEVTSHVPFTAILHGRQSLAPGELGRPVLIGLGIYALLLLLHPYLFGVRPF